MKNLKKSLNKQLIKVCPTCNHVLTVVIHGLAKEECLKKLKRNKIPYYEAGCCCFGDDRDEEFYCSSCDKKYDENLNLITLVACPRVEDFEIRQEECCDEIKLESKYRLKDKKYCEACKLIIENNDDEYRKAACVIGLSDKVIKQVVEKKNSSPSINKTMTYKSYLCEEEEVVHRLICWDKT